MRGHNSLRLIDYYNVLQLKESPTSTPMPFVASWNASIVRNIISEFGSASSSLIGKSVGSTNWSNITNQAKGNTVAKGFAALTTSAGFSRISIDNCSGAGYPDRLLKMTPASTLESSFSCALELKATSNWNPKDCNRRVITSSSKKLRNQIQAGSLPAPPCHLLLTVIYDDSSAVIDAVRLDFLEPDTEINVRLEAATSHKLLTSGSHHSYTF